MGETFNRGESREPTESTEEELKKMSYGEFRKYQSRIESRISSEQDTEKRKELLNSLFNIEARREQRLAIPAMILTQSVLLKYDYPKWYLQKKMSRSDEDVEDLFKLFGIDGDDRNITELESRVKARIEAQRDFLERIRKGDLPDDWNECIIYPLPDPNSGFARASNFWGHGIRALGFKLRRKCYINDFSDMEKIDFIIDEIAENFSGDLGYGVEPFRTPEFGADKNIEREQIEEVAKEIGFADMVIGKE